MKSTLATGSRNVKVRIGENYSSYNETVRWKLGVECPKALVGTNAKDSNLQTKKRMIQLLGRYAWVHFEGHFRLLHVEREEPGDVKTTPRGGWIAFAQVTKSEAQMAYEGVRYSPDRIVEELELRRVPYRIDEEQALILISTSHFQKFMEQLVLDPVALSDQQRSQLLTERNDRLYPKAKQPKLTKVKKHLDHEASQQPRKPEKPLSLPAFSVHPGATVEQWGPMLQTGMISEAFRALSFYSHDCNMEINVQESYQVFSVLHRDRPFAVTRSASSPETNCRILVASNALPSKPGGVLDRWMIPAPSHFLIVDNYRYRAVTQITLLSLTETQVPFFRSGVAPQMMTLTKKGRSDLHQLVSKGLSKPVSSPIANEDFSATPRILVPHGDWLNNPAVIAWLGNFPG